jgi:hypothetical protein
MKLPRVITLAGVAAALVLVTGRCHCVACSLAHRQRVGQGQNQLGIDRKNIRARELRYDRPSVVSPARLVIDNTEISLEDNTRASIRSVRTYPSIYHLLTGRIIMRRALLQEPRTTYRVPQHSGTPLNLEGWEEPIRSDLVRLTEESPISDIHLSNGSGEISIGDKPPILLEDVALKGSPPLNSFDLQSRRARISGNNCGLKGVSLQKVSHHSQMWSRADQRQRESCSFRAADCRRRDRWQSELRYQDEFRRFTKHESSALFARLQNHQMKSANGHENIPGTDVRHSQRSL